MGTECFEMRSLLKYSRLIFRVPLLGSLLSIILGRSQCISQAQLSPTWETGQPLPPPSCPSY